MSPGDSTTLSAPKQENPFEWTGKNAINPLLNAALIEPINTVAKFAGSSTGQKPSFLLPSLEVSSCRTYSTEYWVQNSATALGSVIPYTIAARCAGGSLRALGCAANMRGAVAAVAASEHTAQIVGAGLYDGMRDPSKGETRLGNALGGATAFSIFEAGNSAGRGLGLAGRLALRPVVGGVGALSHEAVSHFGDWTSGRLPSQEDLTRTIVTGAVLNSALPAVQEGSRYLVDRANLALGRGVPIDRHLQADYSSGSVSDVKPQISSLLKHNPWTRVQTNAHENSYRVKQDLVSLSSSSCEGRLPAGKSLDSSTASGALDRLLHELQHRADVQRKVAEPGFKRAAEQLRLGHNEQAWQTYRSVRLAGELRACLAERAAGEGKRSATESSQNITELKDQIASATTRNGKTYEQIWKDEFEKFKQSGGISRPELEFSLRDLRDEARHAKQSEVLVKLLAGKSRDKLEQKSLEGEARSYIDAVEARNDLSARDKADIYLMCCRMLQGESSVAKELKPKELVEDLLDLVAYPMAVKQGRHPTCAPAAIEFITYSVNPKQAAWLVGMTSRFGSYRTHDGSQIVLSDLSRASELNFWNRQHASSLFQTTAANIHWQRQNEFRRYVDDWYISKSGPPGFLRYERQSSNSHRESPFRFMDYSSNPPAPLITQSIYRDIKTSELSNPHITSEGINDIFAQIHGPESRPNGINLPERPANVTDLHDALVKRKQAGELPSVLLVDTRNKPFRTESSSEGGPHAIVVTDFDAARGVASTFNPWGGSSHRTFELKELWRATREPQKQPISDDEILRRIRDQYGIDFDI